jgi:hypothetical protein
MTRHDGSSKHDGLRSWASRFWEGLLIRLEALAIAGVAMIIGTVFYRTMLWTGVSERVNFALSMIVSVTLFWGMCMYWIYIGLKRDNDRVKEKDGKP